MTWAKWHRHSEVLAVQAEDAERAGHNEDVPAFYAGAAAMEERALHAVPLDKVRTFGITAVSAACLWIKAGESQLAAELARRVLERPDLPKHVRLELETCLQKEPQGRLPEHLSDRRSSSSRKSP